MGDVPMHYQAALTYDGGREIAFDLEEKGWLQRPELRLAERFALRPRVAGLPTVVVDLSPLRDGTPRRLVYFRRQFRTLATAPGGYTDSPQFVLYCLGWQATVGGRNVKSLLWIYPTGAVINADEPPFVNEMFAELARRAAEISNLQSKIAASPVSGSQISNLQSEIPGVESVTVSQKSNPVPASGSEISSLQSPIAAPPAAADSGSGPADASSSVPEA